jgi:AcrR family transcriptional regulator
MRKSVATKSHILEKSIEVFNTKGYNATSISDLTRVTGTTKGAIYGNFANKEAVAVAAFEYAINVVLDQLRIKIGEQTTAPQKLKAILTYYEDYILNPPITGGCPLINAAIESDDSYPVLKARVVRIISTIRGAIEKIIYRGIKEGQIIPDVNVQEFTATFYASIKGAIILSRIEGDLTSYQLIANSLNSQIEDITTK